MYITVDELSYTIYICSKNNNEVNCNSGKTWNIINDNIPYGYHINGWLFY